MSLWDKNIKETLLVGLVSFYSKAQPFLGSQTPQKDPRTRTAESNFESAIPSKPKIVFTKSELIGSEQLMEPVSGIYIISS